VQEGGDFDAKLSASLTNPRGEALGPLECPGKDGA